MRLLLLHSSSDLYGASKIFCQTTLLLQQKGHHCEVVLSSEGLLSQELRDLGVSVHIVNLGILRRKYFTPAGLVDRLKKWIHASKVLSQLIQEKNIDAIYSNTAAVLIGCWLASKKYKTATGLDRSLKHFWHIHEIIQKPVVLRWLIQWGMTHFTYKVIAVSAAVKNSWVQKNNILGRSHVINKRLLQKIEVVYNGILPLNSLHKKSKYLNENIEARNFRSKYSIPQEAMVIGMAGRIHYWKGQDYFLQIAKSLIANTNKLTINSTSSNTQSLNNIQPSHTAESIKNSTTGIDTPSSANPILYFIITGDAFAGYEYLVEELNFFINQHNLGAQIFYTGFEKDMDQFYSAIDVLILPSQLPDPLPTVVLEAMQYGIPVVATPQGGALEMIVENETGIFIPLQNNEKNVAIAAQQIQNILTHQLLNEMGANAKKRVAQHFSAAVFEQKIIQLVEN